MRRAIVSPLASAFVLPGLGQILNRQPGKGTIMIMAATVLFLGTLFLAFVRFSQAVMAVGDPGANADKWALLRGELANQGLGWFFLLLGLYLALWLYGVIDAHLGGKRRDQEAKTQPEEEPF